MKVKVFQNLMLAFCFVLVLSACKKPDAPVVPEPDLPIVEDPYQTITENKVLLPILIREPDMDKVIEAEKKRGGTLLEKLLPDPKREEVMCSIGLDTKRWMLKSYTIALTQRVVFS